MAFIPLQSIKHTTTVNSPSGSPISQRVALPSLGETSLRFHFESGTSVTGIYFLFGDSSVVVTSSSGMLIKQTEFPQIIGVPVGATHLSFITSSSSAVLNITFGAGV